MPQQIWHCRARFDGMRRGQEADQVVAKDTTANCLQIRASSMFDLAFARIMAAGATEFAEQNAATHVAGEPAVGRTHIG
jgi:hypothetical protein